MPFKAGSETDYGGSMAEAMEQALDDLWRARTGDPLPLAGGVDRRLLFAAISRGVLQHLKDQAADGFEITVTVQQTVDQTVGLPPVESSNPAPIPVTLISGGGWQIVTGRAVVEQQVPVPIESRGAGIVSGVVVDDIP